MKVTGFSFIKDALTYDYPIVEAITSILPVCDEFVVAVGRSNDETLDLISKINSSKIKIIHTIWDESLREGGQVLAIGGGKEKVLAAHRNGLTTVILPKRNEQDIDDVPEEIRSSMKFIFAESVEDVIDAALEKAKPEKKQIKKPVKKKSTTTKAKKSDNGKNTARRR